MTARPSHCQLRCLSPPAAGDISSPRAPVVPAQAAPAMVRELSSPAVVRGVGSLPLAAAVPAPVSPTVNIKSNQNNQRKVEIDND